MADLETLTGTDMLALHWEAPYTVGDNLGNLFQSWFIAPASTKYRFYMACDDECELWMSETPNDIAAKAQLLKSNGYSNHRQYWTLDNGQTRASKWVTLTQGSKYYIEGRHVESNGDDHFTVAVEI